MKTLHLTEQYSSLIDNVKKSSNITYYAVVYNKIISNCESIFEKEIYTHRLRALIRYNEIKSHTDWPVLVVKQCTKIDVLPQ